MRALREDDRQAGLSGADCKMLDYTMKLTRTPAAMTREDIEELRAAGFDDPAIHDIVQITGFFSDLATCATCGATCGSRLC